MTQMGDKNIFEGRGVILLLLSEILGSTFIGQVDNKNRSVYPLFCVKHACILKEHCCGSLYTPTSLKAKKKFCNVLETICPM